MKNLFEIAFKKENDLDEIKRKNENSDDNYSINENKSTDFHNYLVNDEKYS